MAKISKLPQDMRILNGELDNITQHSNQIATLTKQVAQTASLPIKTGNGSPEGTIFATVGTMYLRLDGGTSTTLYIKETGGSLATGWVPK